MSDRSPDLIRDEAQLDDLLSEPTEGVVETLARLDGDLLVLGASGKMGPSLARMARRALDEAGSRRAVFAVARFSAPGAEDQLRAWGVKTIRADLLAPGALEALPDVPHVVFMAGMKFGATSQPAETWAINTFLPGLALRRFASGRVVALSTGNIYGPTPVERGGSKEADEPSPRGEYAMSCLGRERIVEYLSRTQGTPAALIRLNYAIEMRYGVLLDVARRVRDREPIDLAMGFVNVIWQGDANAMILQALEHADSPALILNVTGPETLSVREIAEGFGRRFGVPVEGRGQEYPDALLSDASQALEMFGAPRVGADRLMEWVADWIERGMPVHNKPTRFEVVDGQF